MRSFHALAMAAVLAAAWPACALQVSENGRFLVTDDGAPFFWLGDTAWRLQRLAPDDLADYLDTRKAQGYTVIQGPILTHDFRGGARRTKQRPVQSERGVLPAHRPHRRGDAAPRPVQRAGGHLGP